MLTIHDMSACIEEAENVLHALRRDANNHDAVAFEQHIEDMQHLMNVYADFANNQQN